MRVQTALRLSLALAAGVAVSACGGEEGANPDAPAAAPAAAPAEPAAAPAVSTGALPEGVTPEMVQMGRELFVGAGICYTCHGPEAQGTALAPSLADDEWLWITPGGDSYEQIVERIHAGVQQPKEFPAPMPPMGGANLTDEQVRALAAYLYSLTHS